MKHRSPEPPRRWLEGWQPSSGRSPPMTRRAELDAYAPPREAGSAGTAGRNYRARTEPAAPTKAADAAKEQGAK